MVVSVEYQPEPGFLNRIAWADRWSDRARSRASATQALDLARARTGGEKDVARALRTLSWQAKWRGGFDEAQRRELDETGRVALPSDYDEPYIVTRRLIEDGRNNLVLRTPLDLPFPVRLLQGTDDGSVTRETALRLLDHADSPDLSLTFVKGADHSFSTPECLVLIEQAIETVAT